MKNILVTGGNSFLAKEFKEYFCNKFNLILTDRSTLDVTDKKAVDYFFNNNKIDYVIHTAIKGGSRLKKDSFDDFKDNINMYSNLCDNAEKYNLMFNFGSGAEFDRKRDIIRSTEEEIFKMIPEDYYGCAKNIISRDIANRNNIINIRLFGCFGKHENDTRFIKSSIRKCIDNEDIFVDDKEMDFISATDLFFLIENYLKNDVKYKDINAVYNKKVDLFYIAQYIKQITDSKSSIFVNSQNIKKNYSGDSKKIDSLDLELNGLEKSIKEMFNAIKWK